MAAAGPGGGLLRALALGDRRDLGRRERRAFARLGIAHLLAVSGLHLALVAALAYRLAAVAVRVSRGRSTPAASAETPGRNFRLWARCAGRIRMHSSSENARATIMTTGRIQMNLPMTPGTK